MYQEKIVLCGANSHNKKYYLNEDFESLPAQIKDELKIMCVLFTVEVGGILTLSFDDEGELIFDVTSEEEFLFDEIGSALKMKELQKTKSDLLEAIQIYYRVFFLGEDLETV